MAENDLIPKKCGADKQIVSREDSLLDIFTDENLLCHTSARHDDCLRTLTAS